MNEPKKSWLSKLFGDRSKTIGVDVPDTKPKHDDEAYEQSWRNRYLRARITYLTGKIEKYKTSSIL